MITCKKAKIHTVKALGPMCSSDYHTTVLVSLECYPFFPMYADIIRYAAYRKISGLRILSVNLIEF